MIRDQLHSTYGSLVMPIVLWLLGILLAASLIILIFSWGNNTRMRTTSIYTFFAGLLMFTAAKSYDVNNANATSLYSIPDQDVQMYFGIFDYLIIILITGTFGWVLFKLIKKESMMTAIISLLLIMVIGSVYFSFRNL